MKVRVRGRISNSFSGSYYGYHDEIDAKKVPLYFKLLFALAMLVVPVGVVVAIFEFSQGYFDRFALAILSIIIMECLLIPLMMILFDKIKYGTVRKQTKLIGGIFIAIGVFLFGGFVLSRFVNFAVILGFGIVMIFYAIGIGMCVAGSKKIKREKNNCTMPVWAVCSGFETLNPHISVLDAEDAMLAQNKVIARQEVARPIWEFQYNGQLVHATPEQYEGKLKIIKGKQYKIFINPDNPQEIYCEENSNAKFLKNMGIVWLIISTFMLFFVGIILWVVMGILNNYGL